MNRGAPTGKGKVAVLALAVALLLVGTLVAYTYTGTRSKSTSSLSSVGSSTTATGNQLTFFNSIVSPDGLQIEVALNTTSLLAGEGLSAEAYLTNTLPRNVSLPVNLTAFPGDSALEAIGRGYACGGAGLLGILNSGLYLGHYTATNFSQEVVPLLLEAPLSHGCPNPYFYVQSNQSIEFAPNSDRATLSGQRTMSMHQSFWTVNATAGLSQYGPSTIVKNGSTTTSSGGTQLGFAYGPVYEGLRGFWMMPPSGNYIFVEPYNNSTVLQALKEAHDLYHEFLPGSYTVVAEDYWNQTVFAYFEVRASPSSSVGGANTVVATATVTETTTTQASQPTTTYAYPPDCAGTHLIITVTSTTTTTVGAASTTTVTVTVTSPSYTQTFTTTTCTYITPTVTSTSTVTTTVAP